MNPNDPSKPVLAICLAPLGDVVPHSYVLHIHSQQCSCGCLHTWSQTYAKTHLRSRTGAGKYVVNLRPLDHPDYNLPVETLRRDAIRVPFCHECINSTTLMHLPRPATAENLSPEGGSQPPRESGASRGANATTKRQNPSAVDLMESL